MVNDPQLLASFFVVFGNLIDDRPDSVDTVRQLDAEDHNHDAAKEVLEISLS